MKEVVIGKEGAEWKVVLSGELDSGNADEFYNTVAEKLDEEPADLHFCCGQLTFIDSTVLGCFVKLLKKAKTAGKGMRLSDLQPKIRKLFTICALDKIMEIDV